MKKRRLAILGSTGSIGTQALEVAALHPDPDILVTHAFPSFPYMRQHGHDTA